MKINTLLSISFFSLLLFASLKCENEIVPKGTKTRVYGSFLDTINNLPIKNQKLYVGEFEDNFAFDGGLRVHFIDNIDSVYTDQNGYYDLTFTATGLGDTYQIYPDYPTYKYTREEYDFNYKYDEIISLDYNQVREYTIQNKNIGKEEKINITNFVHVYPCTVKINLDNIIHLPIYISYELKPYYAKTKFDTINQGTRTIEKLLYINTSTQSPIVFSRNLIGRASQSTRVFWIEPTYLTESTSFEINLKNSDFK